MLDDTVKNARLSDVIDKLEKTDGPSGELSRMARQFLVDEHGDPDKASVALIKEIMDNLAKYRGVVMYCVENACTAAVEVNKRHGRKVLWDENGANASSQSSVRKFKIYPNWYEWPLSSGIRLGDATKADLDKEAHLFQLRGNDAIAKVAFFTTLAQHVEKRKAVATTVRQVLTQKQIKEIHNTARAKANSAMPIKE